MGDLLAIGMSDAAVLIPDLLMLQTLALLDDLGKGSQRRLEIADHDDSAAATVVQIVADLPPRIAAEHDRLAEVPRQANQTHLERLVELADRLIQVVLRKAVMLAGPLNLQERRDGLS